MGEPDQFFGCNLEGVEIVFAAEGDEAAVRRELGVLLGCGGEGELVPLPGVRVQQKQVSAGRNQDLFAGIGPGEELFGYVPVAPVEGIRKRGFDGFGV